MSRIDHRPRRRSAPFLIAMAMLCTGAPGLARSGLDTKTAVAGLREALDVGTERAVASVGRAGGFLDNPEIRIPLPNALEPLEKPLKLLGREELLDDFVESMNRAAESAAPATGEIFKDAIRDMSFDDAKKIVRGRKHEATDYLRKTAGPRLFELIQPVVATKMTEVGATRDFQALTKSTAELPFVDRPVFELDVYVTEKALDGIFLMIAREEERIREDPLARSTELLETVFGKREEDDVPWWKRLFSGSKD